MEQIELKVRIDKQGRLVIPSSVRKAIGISGETEGLLKVRKGKIIIEIVENNVRKSVEKWYEEIIKMRLRAFSSKEEATRSRWMSDEYAKKKLGVS